MPPIPKSRVPLPRSRIQTNIHNTSTIWWSFPPSPTHLMANTASHSKPTLHNNHLQTYNNNKKQLHSYNYFYYDRPILNQHKFYGTSLEASISNKSTDHHSQLRPLKLLHCFFVHLSISSSHHIITYNTFQNNNYLLFFFFFFTKLQGSYS